MVNKQEIERTFNFAEANIENVDTIRLFRDYMDRHFLVGYCKADKRKWVKENNLYAVRPESAKRRGGIDENNPKTFAVDYIVLYTNANVNKYKVYLAEGCTLYSQEEIEGLGYGEVEHRYIVYKLGKEVLFEDIDLRYLLKHEIEDNNPYAKPPIYLIGRTIFSNYRKDRNKKVGLVDADLLCNGTRHPNLVLLKIAGYLYDNNVPFELISDSNADTTQYAHIFMSRVFTFTDEPSFYTNAIPSEKKKFHTGGTGYYADEKNIHKFRELRNKDMEQLPKDEYLLTLTCRHTGKKGINMAVQMPYYHLYDELEERVVAQIKRGEIHEAADVRKLGEIIKAKSKPAKKVLARYVEGKETLNAAYEELKDSGQINDILQKFTRFKEYINDTDLDEKIGSSQKELQDKLAYEIKGIIKRLGKLQNFVK